MWGKKGTSYWLDALKAECPDFQKYMTRLSTREQMVINQRLQGKTLEEIGKVLPRSERVGGGTGVIRERVRQIEAKACRRLRWAVTHA